MLILFYRIIYQSHLSIDQLLSIIKFFYSGLFAPTALIPLKRKNKLNKNKFN